MNAVAQSPPARRRGLKLARPVGLQRGLGSPPARRRGLKQVYRDHESPARSCRLPRGGVD